LPLFKSLYHSPSPLGWARQTARGFAPEIRQNISVLDYQAQWLRIVGDPDSTLAILSFSQKDKRLLLEPDRNALTHCCHPEAVRNR
jgi:hypothetical protein